MQEELVQIDPTLPLCWESLQVLRFGFDHAVIRLHAPSAAAQRMLTLLRSGVPANELAAAGRRAGLSGAERKELLNALAPVLVSARQRALELSELRRAPNSETDTEQAFAVVGTSPFAAWVREALVIRGLPLAADIEGATFAVVIEQFLEPSARAQQLLSEHIPHLSLRVTDRSLWIGPLVPAGGAPCLSCVELHSLHLDRSSAALAAQLLDESPGAATAACAEFALALIWAIIGHWRQGVSKLVGSRLRYAVEQGVPALTPSFVEHISPHRECGCVAFSEAATQQLGQPPPTFNPDSAMNREGARGERYEPIVPEIRSTFRARVKAT